MIDIKLTRKKIINLAVSGELTKGIDTNIDSIDELSKLIGRPIINQDCNGLFELKKRWHWLKLEQLVNNSKTDFADGPFGSNLKTEHYTKEKQVRIIQLSNVGEFGWADTNEKYTTFQHLEAIKRSEVKAGNIVIAKMMPAGRAIIVPKIDCKFVLSSDCIKFVPYNFLNIKYLCYAINSDWFRQQVSSETNGIGRERTSLSKLKQYLLPIPSINEQELIVKKIDEFFVILDDIDKNQLRFKSDCISLNSKIIEAGISGQLTEQLDSDGNAEDLYIDIQKEKEKLIKLGKIKKCKSLPEIIEDEKPFDIPKNWKWCRLENITYNIGTKDKQIKSIKTLKYGKYPVVSQGLDYIDGYCNDAKKVIKDIPVIIFGDHNRNVKYIDFEFVVGADGTKIFKPIKFYTKYLYYWTKITATKLYNRGYARHFNLLKNELVPLPPLAEQKRIVEKLDTLLEKQ